MLQVDQKRPHKLALAWEGPFIITKVLHNGAYHLYNVAKKEDEPRSWNADMLRRFYTPKHSDQRVVIRVLQFAYQRQDFCSILMIDFP